MWEALLTLQRGLPPWAADAWRYANGLLLLALVFVPLERWRPLHRPLQPMRDWGTDLAYYFISSLLPARLIAPLVVAVVWLMQTWAPQGLFPALGALPAPARLGLALLVSEAGLYWGHRAMHAVPWLWRFHALHHSPTQLNWMVNTRAHPLDLVFTRLCGLLPLYVLGLAQPQRAEPDWLPLLVVMLASLWGYVIHANLRCELRLLEPWLSTPAFHHRHHARLPDGEHRSGNYAALLPLMDRLFGTLAPRQPTWPERYGTDTPVPEALVDQMLAPFMGPPPSR